MKERTFKIIQVSNSEDIPTSVFKSSSPYGAAKKAGTMLKVGTGKPVEITLRCQEDSKTYTYQVSQVEIPKEEQEVSFKSPDGTVYTRRFRTRTRVVSLK